MSLKDWSISALGNTSIAGVNIAENAPFAGMNDMGRAIMAQSRNEVAAFGASTITAATTITLDADGAAQVIDGTTTITGIATAVAGVSREAHFATATPIVHSSTLQLPGGSNILTRSGDVLKFRSLGGSLGWRCTGKVQAVGTHGMDLLSTQTASNSATLNFVLSSYTPVYNSFQFRLIGLKPATDGATLWIRTSTDGGSNYDSGASDYDWIINNLQAGTNTATGDAADSEITTANVVGSANAESIRGVVDLFLATSTAGSVQFNWNLGYCTTDGSLVLQNGLGRRLAAADIDAVRFLFDSGNITQGFIQLYGIR